MSASLMKRYGALEQAETIAFLASDEVAHVTAPQLPVASGGLG